MLSIPEGDLMTLAKKHSFWTWSAQAYVNPFPISHAEGVYIWDISGNRYLDLNSMTMCVNVGHGNRKIIDAICEQANKLTYAAPGMITDVRAMASKLIAEISPGKALQKVLFTLGGADANENAIKLARGYTGKTKILSRFRSYHGATMGAMAITGDPRRVAWEPLTMPGVVHFLDPFRYRSTFHRNQPEISDEQFTEDYLLHLREIIQYEGSGTIAAILIESVTGTNGIIIPPDGYLIGVREICDEFGIVLIADEVMSGFGRTGKWFAVNHWDVIPDIITMAKGLTSAYAPLGAVAMKREIADAFNGRPFESGLTYTAHPISLAAAIANIQVLEEENIIENAASMGLVLRGLLNDLGEKHDSVGDVRSIGLFGIIELVKNRKTKEPLSPWNTSSSVMGKIRKFCLDNGLFLYVHWHTILIIPPLIITKDQLKDAMEVLDKALDIADRECVK